MDNQQPSLFEGRICRICGEEKPQSEFHVFACKSRGSRITDECKDCHKERLHKWYLERKRNATPEKRERHRLQSKKWRDEHPAGSKAISLRNHRKSRDRDRNLVYAYYGGKCSCCGELDWRFLTIDHVNNDGHIERKKGFYTNGSQFYRYIVKNNFPKDYRILWFNCNLGRARNGGVCPHQEGSTTISSESTAKRLEAPSTLRGSDIV